MPFVSPLAVKLAAFVPPAALEPMLSQSASAQAATASVFAQTSCRVMALPPSSAAPQARNTAPAPARTTAPPCIFCTAAVRLSGAPGASAGRPRARGRARLPVAARVHRPHLEGVRGVVGEPGHRVARRVRPARPRIGHRRPGRGAEGGAGGVAVRPAADRAPAGARGPGERHPRVAAGRGEGRRGSRAARSGASPSASASRSRSRSPGRGRPRSAPAPGTCTRCRWRARSR